MKTLLALIAIALAGCAGSTYQINNYQEDPKAKSADYQGKKLFVAPLLLAAASAGNSSSAVDSGKQALLISKEKLAETYNTGLTERFRKKFKGVTVVQGPDLARYNAVLTPEKLEETAQFFGKGQAEYYFKHPKREVLDSLGIQADLVLYVTSLAVSIRDVAAANFKASGGGMGGGSWGAPTVSMGAGGTPTVTPNFIGGGGGGGGDESMEDTKKPKMIASVKYIIWDFGKASAAAYGQFQIENGVDRDDIQGHWDDITRTVTDRIVSHTGKLN